MTAVWLTLAWVAVGLIFVESGFHKFPEYRQRPDHRWLAVGIICFWPFLLAVVLCRRVFKK